MIVEICCKRTQHGCMNCVIFFLCVCVCDCVKKAESQRQWSKTTPHGAIKKVHGQYSLVRATMVSRFTTVKIQTQHSQV